MRSALSTASTGISTPIASTSMLSVTHPWTSPPSLAGSGCAPGRDGIPSSWFGHLMCGDYLTHPLAHALRAAGQLAALWPLLAAVVVAITCVRVGWAVWRRACWRAAATSAVWWEIVPPVTATPAATLALWRLLATLLRAPRRLAVRPCRLVWEVVATPDGMRCGLWVPAGVNPTAVLRALQRAWPGVRAERTDPPYLPHVPGSWPLVGVSLLSSQADWLPLVDDADPVAAKRFASSPEADRIAAVYDGLAAAGRTGGGLLQVHVGRAPGHRVAVLRRATVNPHRARRPRGGARVAVVALETARVALGAALDFVMPGPSSSSGSRTAVPLDPATVDQTRQARIKYATPPHLIVAVRLFATGPTADAARAAVADAGSGYSLLSAHWQRRRLWRPAAASWWRWVPENRMQVATVAETAALTGLPAEPSTYGLPAAGSRRLPARRDVFTTPDNQRPDHPRNYPRPLGLGDGDGDDPNDPAQHDQNPDGRHHNGQHPNEADDSPTALTAP